MIGSASMGKLFLGLAHYEKCENPSPAPLTSGLLVPVAPTGIPCTNPFPKLFRLCRKGYFRLKDNSVSPAPLPESSGVHDYITNDTHAHP